MMSSGSLLASLKTHYDKLLAAAAGVLLLACLVYLGGNIGKMRQTQKDEGDALSQKKPVYPRTTPAADDVYLAARDRLQHPFQVVPWTNTLFVPETRVWCVYGKCRRPIPLLARTCPFCNTEQPWDEETDPKRDRDRDGMPDEWELKHGLNPRDPSDAALDNDNDGFTNLQECQYGTSPLDASERPPVTANLEVVSVRPIPFKLLFKSVSILPDGSQTFFLNAADNRTHFAKLGDKVEGFVVEKFEPKVVEVELPGTKGKVKEDRSILYLNSQGKVIPLVRGEVVPHTEYVTILRWGGDGKTFSVQPNSTFEVQGEQFKVISVDSEKKAVVIQRAIDGKQFELNNASRTESREAKE